MIKKKQTSYLFRNTSRQTTNTQQASSVVVKLRKIILNRWFNVDNFITALGTSC